MNNFRIFTESKADVKFLKDYSKEIFNKDLADNDFDPLGSWSGYKTKDGIKPSIKENAIDNDRRTILILDADVSFSARLNEVKKDFAEFNIIPDIFLFPNNAHDGNIETLLAAIATNRPLMDCFLEYEKCVKVHPKPLNDARIYSYLDMLLHPNPIDAHGKDLRKEEFRNYRIQAHWNLNHAYLAPLKGFLSQFLSM